MRAKERQRNTWSNGGKERPSIKSGRLLWLCFHHYSCILRDMVTYNFGLPGQCEQLHSKIGLSVDF